MNDTIIIGIGNDFRCDDAIGIITVKKLKEMNIPEIDLIEHNRDGAELMDIWNNYTNVFIIDAASMRNSAGSIHRIDALKNKLPNEIGAYSTHLFSVAEAIETSKILGKLPEKFIIYAIEGKNFNLGTEVSKEVLKASNEVIKNIINEIGLISEKI